MIKVIKKFYARDFETKFYPGDVTDSFDEKREKELIKAGVAIVETKVKPTVTASKPAPKKPEGKTIRVTEGKKKAKK